MIFQQSWQGARVHKGEQSPWFPATVPGNIQADYGHFMDFPDVNYSDNCKLYEVAFRKTSFFI